MFIFKTKKEDTKFGPPYAVFNLSKIGLRYFRIGINASAHSKDKLVAHAAAHPNVGWIFSAEGWFNLAIGFWARDNAEINDISTQIRAVLTPQDSIVFQSELTGLYSFGNRAIGEKSKAMCIVDATMSPIALTPLEVDYIKLMALDSSIDKINIAEILNVSAEQIEELKNSLFERGVIVGYQDRINYGSTYYKVFIDSLSRKHPRAVDNLAAKLWETDTCTYFERANDKYDIEFEAIFEHKSEIKELLKDFSDYQIVVLTENLYTNLFPLNKTANLKEIRDAFANQQGSVIDLRNSKLWYLNYQGVESYLNVNENRKYFEAMSKGEIDLFDQATKYIRDTYASDSFNIIDIGSGDGLKGRIFIEKLGDTLIKAYFPIDIQPIELAAALKAHNAGHYPKHPTLLPIENLSARFPLQLLPGERQVYIFFGGTYGNFPPEIVNDHLKKLLSDSGILVISMPIIGNKKTDEEIIDSYATSQVEGFSFGPLSQIGFTRDQFEKNLKNPELIMQPKIENHRLITTYTLKNEASVLDKKFEKGTSFQVTTSWKPTLEEFKSVIERDFKAQFFQNEIFAIAVIEKTA